jgi:hypothetical protein
MATLRAAISAGRYAEVAAGIKAAWVNGNEAEDAA